MIAGAVAASVSHLFQKHSFYDRVKEDFLHAQAEEKTNS